MGRDGIRPCRPPEDPDDRSKLIYEAVPINSMKRFATGDKYASLR